MDAALASIFEALQARDAAPLLCTDDGTISASDFLRTIEDISTVPPRLREALARCHAGTQMVHRAVSAIGRLCRSRGGFEAMVDRRSHMKVPSEP